MTVIAEQNLLRTAYERIARLPRTHFIGGEFRGDLPGTLMDLVNPADGQTLGQTALGTAAVVDEAVKAAAAAQPAWRALTPVDRSALLLRLADLVDQNTNLLVQIESLNCGKPLGVAGEEIPGAADALRFFAGACRTAQAPASGEYVSGHTSIVRREPVGVVGAVTPWNYPLMMAVWKIAPALAAGNTIVLKPSEQTPLTTLLFAELTASVLPAGVLNVVLGTGSEVGEALTRHPGIGMISLTGSVASGHAVARGAAETLKRVHLELGGKAPVIVFPDANLADVVDTLRVMGLWNTGQECGAATRVLCHADVQEALIEQVSAAFAQVQPGNPADSADLEMGPLISRRQLDQVAAMVEQARRDGADVPVGGAVIDRPGFYYEPTLVTDAPAGSEILSKEIFGPVVTVQSFTTEQEAIELANGVDYGLAASIWTQDLGRSLRVSDALDFGTVWVNSHLTLASEMPWGGFGLSGYGRDMSVYALDDYTRTKHVMLAIGRN